MYNILYAEICLILYSEERGGQSDIEAIGCVEDVRNMLTRMTLGGWPEGGLERQRNCRWKTLDEMREQQRRETNIYVEVEQNHRDASDRKVVEGEKIYSF